MSISWSMPELEEIFNLTNRSSSKFSGQFHTEFKSKLHKKHDLKSIVNLKDWLNDLDGLSLQNIHKLFVTEHATVTSICKKLEGSNIETNFSKISDTPESVTSTSSSGTTLPTITVGAAGGGPSFTMEVTGGHHGGHHGGHLLVHGGRHILIHGGGIPMMGGGLPMVFGGGMPMVHHRIHVPHPAGTFIVPHGFVLRR